MHYLVFYFVVGLAVSPLVFGHESAPLVVPKEEALTRLLAPIEGAGQVVSLIGQQQVALKARPEDAKTIERLGRLFIAQARIASNESFYSRAELCGQLLEMLDTKNPEALLLRGHCLLAMHQFHDAEEVAKRLLQLRRDMQDHALLGDALMEQGQLDGAEMAYQAMIDAKPCLPSYSRVAHFRWLRGDALGAIEVAEQAVACGSYRDPEPLAWVTTRLAFYLWQTNALDAALQAGQRAEKLVSGYPQALYLQGRVLLAQGKKSEAAECLRKAAAATPLAEIQWALEDAEGHTDTFVSDVDPRSLALYLATKKQRVGEALDLAKREVLKRRDVYSWDALAWAQNASGEPEAAAISMKKALAAGTQDARLFLHAAIILSSPQYAAQARAMTAQLLPSEQALLTTLSL